MKSSEFTLVAALGLVAAATAANAQNQSNLDLGLYPGLSISGTAGAVYSIEYSEDPTNPDPSGWRCLEFVQLPDSPFLWVDKSAPATAKRFYRAVEFAAPTNLVFIPPGTFRMSSPEDEVGRQSNEGPQTAVTMSRGYWMGRHEVTQGEYEMLVGKNPSFFNGVFIDHTGEPVYDFGIDLTRPVEQVSWIDATNYCALLTQQERAAGRIPAGCVYRLPTEVEWEYACRAWTSTRFNFGDDPDYTRLTEYAWYFESADSMVHPVGQKLPSPWGLYDMHGNLAEWCQKVDGELFLYNTTRGGGWATIPSGCRSAARISYDYQYGDINVGFRVVLGVNGPPPVTP